MNLAASALAIVRTSDITPQDAAVDEDRGATVLDVERSSAAIHRHRFQIKRIEWGSGDDSFYIEVREPGACDCVRRVDMSRLIHVLLNTKPEELIALEDRETCASCGHRHHVDDRVEGMRSEK